MVLARSFPAGGNPGPEVLLPAILRAVRACTWLSAGSAARMARRTYIWRTASPAEGIMRASFPQVRGYMEVQAGAVCKTVGSAYVGSNPTPATHFRRSEPVTPDGVTGFWRERERLRGPSAVSRGLCVGRIRPSPGLGAVSPQMPSELRKH